MCYQVICYHSLVVSIPKPYNPLICHQVTNRFHLTLIHQMAFSEQLKYRIAVKALQILCFFSVQFFVQYLNFVCRVILWYNDNLNGFGL